LWRWGSNSRATRKKKQARLILRTLILAFIIGTVVDIIPPHLGLDEYPDLSIIFILIPALGILYSIEKYKLMALSPDRIAGDILETMNEGLIVTDNIGIIKMVNQSTLNQLNYKNRELLNESIDKIIKDDSLIYSFFSGTNPRDMIKYQDKVLETNEGKELPVLFSIATLKDDWGDNLGLICTFSNIKERVEAEEKLKELNEELEAEVARRTEELQYLANHDSLTRLPNRRLFIDRLNRAITQAETSNKSIMVAMLDLDGFKKVNDTLGHEKGDDLLKMAAERLRENLRDNDIVARYGGDEFIIKCKDINNKKSARVVSDKIFNSFQKPFTVGGKTFEITASMGVAFYPEDGHDVETLTENADQAMYVSKKAGKNKYTFYAEINYSNSSGKGN
ncbi:MAG: diguanylate cyclase domain-containing protein, partial [Bacillota bacterium]